MKKHTTAFLIVMMSMIFTGCITTRSTRKINEIELGMTKEEIRTLFGKPVYRNAWQEGEEWGYHKQVGEISGPEQVLLIIYFDGEGEVSGFKTEKEYPRMH